jgi:hypothetical protein
MHNAFGLFIALFAAFWLFSAARWMAKELKAPERAKWIKGTMYLLILIGVGGFFAAALSATALSSCLPPMNGLLATFAESLRRSMASTLSRSCPQEESKFTIRNGTSSEDGMLTLAGVISRFGVPQME